MIELGARVFTDPKHWLRPNEEGTVIEVDYHGACPYLVQFGQKGPGIDGNKLWFDVRQLRPALSRAGHSQLETSEGTVDSGKEVLL